MKKQMRETIDGAASAFSEFDYVEYYVETCIIRYLRGGRLYGRIYQIQRV